jgi:hypothetical protein
MINPTVNFWDMVACVDREIMMRKRNYPRWVSAGKMPDVQAVKEIARMTAVREALIVAEAQLHAIEEWPKDRCEDLPELAKVCEEEIRIQLARNKKNNSASDDLF